VLNHRPLCHCLIFGCLITLEIMYLLIVFLPLLGSSVAGCFGRFFYYYSVVGVDRFFFDLVPPIRRLPYHFQIIWCLILKILRAFIFIYFVKSVLAHGYLWMDELSRAYSQFYPNPSGSGGGYTPTPQPGPTGDSSFIPFAGMERNQDSGQSGGVSPGPGPAEGQTGDRRDYISEHLNDPILTRSYRNFLITKEQISLEMERIMRDEGIRITDFEDLRKGVDLFLTDIEDLANPYYAKKKSTLILQTLTTQGSASKFYSQILEEIQKVV
jgi:hypothetical protein